MPTIIAQPAPKPATDLVFDCYLCPSCKTEMTPVQIDDEAGHLCQNINCLHLATETKMQAWCADELTAGFAQLGREVDAFLADLDAAIMIDAVADGEYARHATIYARF